MKHMAVLFYYCCLLLCMQYLTNVAQAAEAFVDEFDTLNTTRWFASHGWTNGEHQNCTWSENQVHIKNGLLVLSFEAQPFKEREYSCGELQSKDEFGYGIYEARMKTPQGSGLVAAFFTYIGRIHEKPHDEIDFEILLKDTSKVQTNFFVSGQKQGEIFGPVPDGAHSDFNDYAFIWEKGRISWYVNQKLVRISAKPRRMPVFDQKIYVSLWGSDSAINWLGAFQNPGERLHFEIDRIAFTPLGKPCQFPQSVACLFD